MPADPRVNSIGANGTDPGSAEQALIGILSASSLENCSLFAATQRALRAIHMTQIAQADRFIAIVHESLSSAAAEADVAVASLESTIYLRPGPLPEAINRAEEGYARASQLGLEAYIAQLANSVGSSYRRLGNYGEADRWYLEALVSARRTNDRSREAGVLSNRALIAKIRGEAQSAVTMLAD